MCLVILSLHWVLIGLRGLVTEGKKKKKKKEKSQRETVTSGEMEEVLGELNTKSERRGMRRE